MPGLVQDLRSKALQRIAFLSAASPKSFTSDLIRIAETLSVNDAANEAVNGTTEKESLSRIPMVRDIPLLRGNSY